MASPHVNGPAHIYYAPFETNDWAYFGTSESGVKLVNQKQYDPVMNDIAGPKVPMDETFASKISYIIAIMTRWDENVYQIMSNAPAGNPLIPSIAPGEIGALMFGQGGAFRLAIAAPYGGTFNDPLSYVYYGVRLHQDEQEPLGTRHKKLPLIWEAKPVYVIASQSFKIYDTVNPGLTLPTPT